jgi:hypothetical protein
MQSVESGWAYSGGEQEKKFELRKITVLKSSFAILLQNGNYVYDSLTYHILYSFFLFHYFDFIRSRKKLFHTTAFTYVRYVHELYIDKNHVR